MRLLTMIGAVCCLLAGCAAPLGETRYPKVRGDEFEGVWEAVGKDENDGTIRVVVDVARGETKYPAEDRPFTVQPERYYVGVRFEGTGDAAKGLPTTPIELDGEFIKSDRWTLYTFQPAMQHQFAFDSLALWAPVQQTLRVERAGDELVVYAPRVQLVYSPVEMAGTLEFRAPPRPKPGEHGGRMLVQRMDDVIATLDKAEAQDWGEPVRLTRVK